MKRSVKRSSFQELRKEPWKKSIRPKLHPLSITEDVSYYRFVQTRVDPWTSDSGRLWLSKDSGINADNENGVMNHT